MYHLNIIQNNLFLNLKPQENIEISDDIKAVKTGYIITRKVVNNSLKIVDINGLQCEINGIYFNDYFEDDYFYANENPRIYGNFTMPIDCWKNRSKKDNCSAKFKQDNRWADSGVVSGNICSSPYQPFPAILLSNYKSKKGIVVGSLCQDVFYHNFQVGHNGEGLFLKIFSSFKGIEKRQIKQGETLTDIFYIGITNNADDINKIFSEYVNVLKDFLPISKSCEINRHCLIWDSWNDGIYRDISEKILLEEARFVKEYFPSVKWFQVDDGYSAYCEKNVDLDAHGIGTFYEGENGIDKNKFPSGLKHYSDEIKKLGLKPSIWIGMLCPEKSLICRENKDWFSDYSIRINYSKPLDVSKNEVRKYVKDAFNMFIKQYGFQGVKLDFWSYVFEERHNLLEKNYKSGYELRNWLFSCLRDNLTDSGYIETGCDLGMGNPFLGKYVNNYRFGIDIGSGNFSNLITTMFWSVAVLSTHIGDYLIANSDSIGLLPGLNDSDFMFAVNFQIITRTLVEISGKFSKVKKDNWRFNVLKRATQYINNGEDVYFAKYNYREKSNNIPEIIYINSAFDCNNKNYITVALFNGSESEKTISFNMIDVGLINKVYQIEYVWENKFSNSNSVSEKIKPHGSLLLKIKK